MLGDQEIGALYFDSSHTTADISFTY